MNEYRARTEIECWRQLYSAQSWYSTHSIGSKEDKIVRILTPGGGDPRVRKVVRRGGA